MVKLFHHDLKERIKVIRKPRPISNQCAENSWIWGKLGRAYKSTSKKAGVCIIDRGIATKYFKLERGLCQGDAMCLLIHFSVK